MEYKERNRGSGACDMIILYCSWAMRGANKEDEECER